MESFDSENGIERCKSIIVRLYECYSRTAQTLQSDIIRIYPRHSGRMQLKIEPQFRRLILSLPFTCRICYILFSINFPELTFCNINYRGSFFFLGLFLHGLRPYQVRTKSVPSSYINYALEIDILLFFIHFAEGSSLTFRDKVETG